MVGLCLALTPALVCSQTLSRSGARSLEPAPTNAAVFAPNATITQGFDAGLACPVGWTCTNNSVPIGATVNWFDGNTTVFAPQAGSGYIGANFNMVTTTNTISAWLISPVVQFGTGAELRFWSRTVDIPTFPDRLEIRTSTGGTNTGGTNMSVGDFTNLLGTINPTLIATAGTCIVPAAAPNALGYPNAWCEYRLTNVDGIPTTGSGRVAFRYFVTDGGPTGDNSDYIGIDTFSFVEGVDCTNVVVTNANDSGAGSLRQAIADACPGSTITFQAGVGSVNLSSGEIVLDKDLTIQGPGAASLRIDSGNTSRLFRVDAGARIRMSGLTLAGGNGVSPVQSGQGSAVLVLGELELQDSVVRENAVGALRVGPNCSTGGTAEFLEIAGTLVTANSDRPIDANCGLTIIRNSTITANGSTATSAVAPNFGRVLMLQSTVAGNTNRGLGSGVYAQASIIAANSAGDLGSGSFFTGGSNLIGNPGSTPIFGITTGDLSGLSAGLSALGAYGGPTQTLAALPGSAAINAVVNAPEVQVIVRDGGDAAAFTLTFNGQTTAPLVQPTEAALQVALESLSSIGSGNVDVVANNAPFPLAVAVVQFTGALADSNQPSITASRPGIVVRQVRDGGAPLATDQRGIARPQGTAPDIGAFESQGFTLAISGGNNQFTASSTAFGIPLQVTVTPVAAGEPVDGGLVTFTPPGAGASASLAPNPATIAGGSGSALATANATVGSYSVGADALGSTGGVNFTLTNAAADVFIDDVAVTEGDAATSDATFTVTRTNNLTAFSVPYNITAGTAQAGSDYTPTSGTLIFAVGGPLMQTINVPVVGDLIIEGTETATLNLGAVTNTTGVTTITDGSGLLTISDNDSAVVAFNPISVDQTEASSPMVFTVTLSNPVQSGVTLDLNSAFGSATAADFTPIVGGTVSFPANSTANQSVNVVINNDALDEDNETFMLNLSGLTAVGNVTVGTLSATGTILDDDPTPTISVTSPAQPEGNGGTTPMNFEVSLSAVSGRDVTFTRATQDGTATVADNDYQPLAAALATIPAGQMSILIPVLINGDTTFEGNESFSLDLTGIVNATPASISGTGTLEDDDQQLTTTTITAHTPSTTVVGQPYTVDVTVSAVTTSPLGNVTISDGAASCGPVALTAGTAPNSSASCSLASTSVGNKTLTATYTPASGAFAASSDTEAHEVNAASTAISVVGPARSRINQPTSFTFALSVNDPGAGSPVGTVTLTSGASSCSVMVPTATLSCALTFNTLGSRTITAAFVPSNGNFLGSSSSGAGNAQTLVFALSDIAVTKSNGIGTYAPGDLIVYTVTVTNPGPDAAAQIRVRDNVPAGLVDVVWSCDASGGVACPQAGGSGNLDHTIASFPVGGLLNYTFYGNVDGSPAQLVNIALVELPADTTIEDPVLGNNSASDTDLLDMLFANGFESAAVNSETGSFRIPGTSLRGVLDEVAVVVYRLDDAAGEALRVYARVVDGELQYALATRNTQGRLRLGAWTALAGDPTLSWTARPVADGWVLRSAELR